MNKLNHALLLVSLISVSFLNYGLAGNILGVFNHPGASHTFLGRVLLEALAKKGHTVTMISAFPPKEQLPNFKHIELTGFLDDLKKKEKMYFQDKRSIHKQTENMSLEHTLETFQVPEVVRLMGSQEKFDVIIIDLFFNEATLMFGHHFKAPVIFMSSFGNHLLLNKYTGNYQPISYVPGAAFPISDDIPFTYRLRMTLVNLILPIMEHFRIKRHEDLVQRKFKNPPTMDQLLDNVALVLANSHFTFETPRVATPNIIPIGGFHVQDLKPLPNDLKRFLDEAKEGVIFFSLGSQIKTSNLDSEVLEGIKNAFGKVPQKVLWKWEDEDIPNLPKNIKLGKWFPQNEILAHPNVKVFITHGGTLSTIETVHHGVPVIAIPFNGDQFERSAFVESRSIGLKLDSNQITEETFLDALKEITENPKYKENAKMYSNLMRNQPVSPMENAIYWVETVIQNKGAPFLKPFSLKLHWYQYYLLDVIATFVLVLTIIIYVIYATIKFVCTLIKKKFKKTKTKPKRKAN